MKCLKKYLFVLSFTLFSFSASAQLWQVFLEPLFIDGFWFTFVTSEGEPTWQETTFANYPYDLRDSGLFLPLDFEGDQSRVNVNLHLQNNENSISGGLLQVRYSPISLLTLDAYRLQLLDTEKADDAENINITSFSVIYNRLRHHKIHAWWGIGGIFMDADDNTGSASFNMGVNYFFKEPLSLYADVQFADLNEEFATIAQARLQVHLKRYLVYGGYHYIDNGAINIGSWTIGGGIYF